MNTEGLSIMTMCYQGQWGFLSGCSARDLQKAPPGSILLCGDSRVAGWSLPSLAGRPVSMLGFGGARARDLRDYAVPAIQNASFDVGIFMIGVNNAFLTREDPETAGFASDIVALIQAMKVRCKKVLATTPLPIQYGFGRPNDDVAWRNVLIRDLSSNIKSAAVNLGVEFLDLRGLADVNGDGSLPYGWTTDGIHFNATAYGVLKSWIEPKVSALLAATMA